ncbi:MAG: DUF6273 domain-containing protein [bacterium]|nr:DUF6273 domain-containing protein [bacterium]
MIKTSNVSNNAGPSTADRIFLLSVDEAQNLFADCKAREAKLTEYAIKNHACTEIDGPYAGNAWWWLRSHGNDINYAAGVSFDGSINDDGHRVVGDQGCISPALRLAISPTHRDSEDSANSAHKVTEVSGSPSPGVNESLLKKASRIAIEDDLLTFGSYPQGVNGEVKPINWRVLERQHDSLLIISEMVLDAKCYNEQKCGTIWSESTLRRWLNEEFINEAFSSEQQSLIKAVNISNNAGPDTKDRIFLLSIDEAEKFFANNDDRICKPTGYARKNGARVLKGNAWWWLRSRGNNSNNAAFVGNCGAINKAGFNALLKDGYVRPTLQLANHPMLEVLKDDAKPASEATQERSSQTSAPPDVKSNPVEDYANAQKGDRLYFGHYPQGPDNAVERITWRVLERDSDSLLVVSEKGLDVQPYNDKLINVAWADCTLRDWLNGEFIKKAFNEQEQSMIKESDLNNNAGPPTKDRVFLPSTDEARALFANSNDRRAEPTAYAINHGVYTNNNSVWWWLRSHGNDVKYAAGVNSDGSINNGGHRVTGKRGCIRPALPLAIYSKPKAMIGRKQE